jgi:hypothetical protein
MKLREFEWFTFKAKESLLFSFIKLPKAKNDISRVELLEFMETLEHECENKLSIEFNHDNFV